MNEMLLQTTLCALVKRQLVELAGHEVDDAYISWAW